MQLLLPDLKKLKVLGRPPSLPLGVRIYAIGDVHGSLVQLNVLLELINEDLLSRPVVRPIFVFLGDYIDRGASSRETIDRLIEHGETYESVFLKGNHELVATKCLRDRNLFDQWLRMGGAETLISYGIMPRPHVADAQVAKLQAAFHAALPPSHVRFFRSLQPSFACGDFFFAHAGVRPGVALSRQKESDMLWIRDEFLSSSEDFGKIIIHGHTPSHEVEVGTNRINIDTGAFATGVLTCLVIEESSVSVIDTLSR